MVVEVGPAVTKAFRPGDRVCGAVHGSHFLSPEGGAFGEYLVAKGDVQLKIPEGMGFEEASTLGVAVVTVGQGLYQGLGFPLPSTGRKEGGEEAEGQAEKREVLIYGGSSAMGMMAIQYAGLSNLIVNTTSSPKNFELLQSLGAHHTFDYHSPSCGSEIRAQTSNKLHHVFDTISGPSSIQICRDAFSSNGNNFYTGFPMGAEFSDPSIKTSVKVAYTALGEEVAFGERGPRFEASREDFEFAKIFTELSERLLEKGAIKPLRMRVGQGGLKGVLEGMGELRQGKVSAEKLVYRVDETA
ncbi:NAD(P)-binding protein [Viridothelium virens]|uniref:NAD(P)-binding protein n=1 Tax=Viridothelium virens TaxID=1048519 RepID=A0A6A6HJV1_VIRVR|nr:NAD(P)-binding protein [Viridothelium virens]